MPNQGRIRVGQARPGEKINISGAAGASSSGSGIRQSFVNNGNLNWTALVIMMVFDHGRISMGFSVISACVHASARFLDSNVFAK